MKNINFFVVEKNDFKLDVMVFRKLPGLLTLARVSSQRDTLTKSGSELHIMTLATAIGTYIHERDRGFKNNLARALMFNATTRLLLVMRIVLPRLCRFSR